MCKTCCYSSSTHGAVASSRLLEPRRSVARRSPTPLRLPEPNSTPLIRPWPCGWASHLATVEAKPDHASAAKPTATQCSLEPDAAQGLGVGAWLADAPMQPPTRPHPATGEAAWAPARPSPTVRQDILRSHSR